MKLITYLLSMMFIFGSTFTATWAQEPNTLTVDTTLSHGEISPYVYGANLGLNSLIPLSLMDEAQALNIQYARFGGGETDRQNLRASIIDMFIYQTRSIGAEPAMSVRLLGGTPEHAADIVRYTNIEKDYDIQYWSIGNEPNLFTALMNIDEYTADDLNREWRTIAEAMLAVDPDIQFVGPDITQYIVLNPDPNNIEYLSPSDALDDLGTDWLQSFLQANGDLLDYVAIHRYPFPLDNISSVTVEELRNNPSEWDMIIPNLREVIRNAAGRDIPIAVTEVNSNSANSIGGVASLDSHFNAIWLADVLGHLIRNQVDIVAYWDLQGSSNRGWGIIGSYNVRPTYYTYMMYTHFGTELLTADSTAEYVSIYAARRDDGALTLMIVNLNDDTVETNLDLGEFAIGGPAEIWRFDQDHQAEQLDSQSITAQSTLSLPGQSLTVYVIPPA